MGRKSKGLEEYLRKQRFLFCVQLGLENFHRRSTDTLSWQITPVLNHTNADNLLAASGI